MSSERTARIEANPEGGRDFVVGDVHGEFPTLEVLLEVLEFDRRSDRLFALGDLVDRGPRSVDALEWMEHRRITLSVRGNYEQMLHDRIRSAERGESNPRTWGMHPWFPRDVPRAEWTRWREAIAAMPMAATVATAHGDVGLVHASPTARYWRETLRKLEAGDKDTIAAALWSAARAQNLRLAAAWEGVPLDGPIAGVRTVLTGHAIVGEARASANVWHLDTGAGSPTGKLTIAQIDAYPLTTTSLRCIRP